MNAVAALTLDYRDPARTQACVQGLLEQGADPVLIWDNSADAGASAATLRAAFAGDPRVAVVQSDENLGFAAGVNRGLAWLAKRSASRPVLLINNDAHLLPGGLQALCDALAAAPTAHIVYPNIDHAGWVRGTVYYQRMTGIISDRKLPGSFPYASGCCLLINPPASGEQLFDEDFFMYGEDIALGSRLSETSNAMVHMPMCLVAHEGSASSGMGTEFYETRVISAHWRLTRKLARNRFEWMLMVLVHWLVLLPRAFVRSLRYRSLWPIVALAKGRAETVFKSPSL